MNSEGLQSESTTFQYRIPFETLGLTADDIARGMGYVHWEKAPPFAEDLDALVSEAGKYAGVEGGFRVYPAGSVSMERDGFVVEDQHFHTGRVIAGPLRGAEALAFFAVTAGPGISRWSQDYMRDKDHLRAYFVDALGSELVEKGADWIEERIVAWATEQGEHTTNRYSPGYCGWSVSEQHKFFSLLPEGFCGIALTESALMQPEKSVSGVIGIGGKAKKRAYGCSICTLENCFRRNTRIA